MSKELSSIKKAPTENKERQSAAADFFEDEIENFIESLEKEKQLKLEEKEGILMELREKARPFREKEAVLKRSFLKKIRDKAIRGVVSLELGVMLFAAVSSDFRGWISQMVSSGIAATETVKEAPKPEIEQKSKQAPESKSEQQIQPEVAEKEVADELSEEAELVRFLREDFEEKIIATIFNTPSIQKETDREPSVKRKFLPIISGFEKFKVPARIFDLIMRETMPAGFVNNILSLSYQDEFSLMPKKYGAELGGQSLFLVAYTNTRTKEMVFTKGSQVYPHVPLILNETFFHEAAHLSGWDSNYLLTRKERLKLLKQIAERLRSANRYHSVYVEKIENENKKRENELRAAEYFAEIVAAYFSLDYFKLPEADRAIVKDLIKKMDSEFDREEALNRRLAIIKETLKNTS